MNSFLKGFFSLFDWMSPKSLDDSLYDLDISMMELYDRMGWGSYSNALKNIYVLNPDMEIVSLEKDMKDSIVSETVYVDGNKVSITTSKDLLDQLKDIKNET
jgi:hypothetical protein